MDSPTQMCSVLPQAKISVSLSAWQHIYIVTGFCVTPPKQEVGCHVHRPRGLCTDKDWQKPLQYCKVISLHLK